MPNGLTSPSSLSLTFLGTGTSTGVPVVACDCHVCQSTDPRDKRLRTSVLIAYKGHKIVIDCGPDFRYQMIRERVDNVDAILLTHEHRDHIAGLDDIRGFNYVLNKTMDIFAEERVIEAIHIEYPYFKTETRFFGAPQLSFHPIDNHQFTLLGMPVIPIRAMHNKLPVLGFRIGGLTYITDASEIAIDELAKIEGSEVIVINALRNSRHVSHFSLEEAVELLKRFNPPGGGYLTHMSHFIGTHQSLEEKLPANIHPAYDGLRLNIVQGH
ncbi:MAG TPA: MBL fold metallo-hydrolase [Bacteroidales bacterium]|mgnify:CR=1 FL=1|nr:MBL fold metallo-hydrolase [Bacteroidales bacterium]